jgi:hypothetical protein
LVDEKLIRNWRASLAVSEEIKLVIVAISERFTTTPNETNIMVRSVRKAILFVSKIIFATRNENNIDSKNSQLILLKTNPYCHKKHPQIEPILPPQALPAMWSGNADHGLPEAHRASEGIAGGSSKDCWLILIRCQSKLNPMQREAKVRMRI